MNNSSRTATMQKDDHDGLPVAFMENRIDDWIQETGDKDPIEVDIL